MGFFNFLFSYGKKTNSQDFVTYYSLNSLEVKEIISSVRISGLSQEEEKLIEEVLLSKLAVFNKISLKEIDRILYNLRREYRIEDSDRKNILKTFETYFKQRQNNTKK
ncbi:MAG: hypothetical protein WC070_04775 [Candidatus Magasanikbacteria bacterium]